MISGYTGYGLSGSGQTASTAVGVSSAVGTPIIASVTAPSVASALGISAGLAVPLIGGAIAGVTIAIQELIANSGCGQTCIVASNIANQAEPLLKQNLDAFEAGQISKTEALNNFDSLWSAYVQAESNTSLGNAGKTGISDRQAGSCKWKATSQPYPLSPAVGACWNWFNGYRDPIANAPDATVSDSISSLFSGSEIWWLVGAVVLIGIGVGHDMGKE